jgi:ATP-dependent DNA helicase RecQ
VTPHSRARTVLKDTFGYDDFRPGQEEIVTAVLAGEDVFAVMPTGSGKSICYQLPAVVDGGLTVVVSPLIALMRDQVRQLAALGVQAGTLNSAVGDDERRDTMAKLDSGELRLLFVSPERLAAGGLAQKLASAGIRRLAIDEAHCVSQWGHDFRPEYRQLSRIREMLGERGGDVQVLAFTATADTTTRADIAAQLFPTPPRTLVHSFDRPNIGLRFEAKDRPRTQIEDFLRGRKGESGIVYTASRTGAERLAEGLSGRGHTALAYHAGLDTDLRSRRQDTFLQEDGIVMVATVAFGMGINKPDVRFVVHADMPGGIESYYQEIGRAGRDGLPAETLTLYGLDDMRLRRRQIDEKEVADERRQIEHRRLGAMVDLCEIASCRRQSLLSYFGEAAAPCGHCDLCLGGATEMADATEDAQKALSAIVRTGQRFGTGHLASILVGEATEAVTRLGHDKLKTFGVGRDLSARLWAVRIRQLFATGALTEASAEHGGFALTEKGEAILFGRERIALRAPQAAAPRAKGERRATRTAPRDGLSEADGALFEALRAVRTAFARAEGVAAFIIFPDRTLIEMAQRRPKTPFAMSAIQGVGQRKLDRYGAAFLDAIRTAE